jgi:hypothetical protein
VVLDRIRGLFKGRGSGEPSAEKPSPQDVAELALGDLKSGLLDGRYGLLVWDKACDDPGMKPDAVYVVVAMDGESLAYMGAPRKGGFTSIQIATGGAPGTATVYIITRSFLNEFLKQIDESTLKKLLVKPEEVAMIRVASPETLRLYNIEYDACMALPIPRRSAEKAISTVISEIEKRIKEFFVEAAKQP